MKAPGGDLDRLLRRLAGRRALARFALCSSASGRRCGPCSASPACSSAPPCSTCRVCCRPVAYRPACRDSVLIVGLLVRGLRGIAAPDDKAADRRLELASGLPHRPLAVLTDRPSRGARGPDTAASHSGRPTSPRGPLGAQAARGLPQPGLARLDPRALRAALVVALVAAVAIAGEDAPSRLAQAMEPTPPRETRRRRPSCRPGSRRPPTRGWRRFPQGRTAGTVSVPAGARLTVSVTGRRRRADPRSTATPSRSARSTRRATRPTVT